MKQQAAASFYKTIAKRRGFFMNLARYTLVFFLCIHHTLQTKSSDDHRLEGAQTRAPNILSAQQNQNASSVLTVATKAQQEQAVCFSCDINWVRLDGVTRQVVDSKHLATFQKVDQLWLVVPCEPLSAILMQDIQKHGPASSFEKLITQGVEGEKICQLYPMCSFAAYRALMETLPCFNQVAMLMSVRARLDPVLAAQLKSTRLEDGTTALDYYHQRAHEARTSGNVLSSQTLESLKKTIKPTSLFTLDAIAAQQTELNGLKKELNQADQAHSLQQQTLNKLQELKLDLEQQSEVTYVPSGTASTDNHYLQLCMGYSVQQNVNNQIMQEMNAVSVLQAEHNQDWVKVFKGQITEKLNSALLSSKNGNMAQAVKEYSDACTLHKYLARVARGDINYTQLYNTTGLAQLKHDVDKRIESLRKLLDDSLCVSAGGAFTSNPAQMACIQSCKPGCRDQDHHAQQRGIMEQINKLSLYRNALNAMIHENDHRLKVTSYECSELVQTKSSSERLNVAGNVVDQVLMQQIVDLRSKLAVQPDSDMKNMLLVLADSTLKLVQTGCSPSTSLECLGLLATYSSLLPKLHAVQGAGIGDVAHKGIDKIAQSLNRQIDELIRDAHRLADFGVGIVQGGVEGGKPIAYVITHTENIPQDLKEKIIAINQAVRVLGRGISQELKDRIILGFSSSQQEREQAALRMLNRAQKALAMATAFTDKIANMSAKDWGHVVGRGAFDIATFNVASKALGTINVSLQGLREAESVLKAQAKVSQALESMAGQLDALTAHFAQKVRQATLPEVVAAGSDISNSWQVLKHEAEQFVPTVSKVPKLLPQSVDVAQALKNIPQTCAGFDKSVVENIAKLEKALETFKDLPGAQSSNGPISRLIQNGKVGDKPGQLTVARGAVYELEAALDLKMAGEEIVTLGQMVGSREFDIVTRTALVECKNINWEKLPTAVLNKRKSDFGAQAKIAKDLGLQFKLCSKQPLTESLREWCKKNNILVKEG